MHGACMLSVVYYYSKLYTIITLFACSVICNVMYIIIHFMRKLLVKLYFKARALLTHSGMGCLAIIVYLLRNASLEKSTCDLDAVGIQVGQTYACIHACMHHQP